MSKISELFKKEIKVINIGLEDFAKDLEKQKVKVVHVAWRPPAGGNERMVLLLAKLRKKG
ncbi:hypothetical protein [Thermotalea metallivorans]|uniref:FdrA domain protein n=1 Tax=Thermotalea metallivorans TaxID=520762 RepID=A0A140L138_9FIRM|nr:hypothetical protein [Thermotalea metallivorans]KXG74263.1 hypothetical protein AN619_24550 [Thermotalea metallivorans]